MSHLFNYLVYFLMLYSCSSCNFNRSRNGRTEAAPATVREERIRIVNSIRLEEPLRDSIYSFGDRMKVRFAVKDRFPVDSSTVSFNGRVIARLDGKAREFSFEIPEGKVGKNSVKVMTWHPGHRQGMAAANVIVKPDCPPERYGYKVEKVFPHSPQAYTQGLIYHGGFMYEGTGQYGESRIRKIDMQNGKELSVLNIDPELFGEGITILGDKIYQITWRSGDGFIYDLASFSLESTFTYNTEGWGITTAGDHLIMSDGSHRLYHIAPSSFDIIREIEVYDHNGKVEQLNELEYVNGLVWANVWLTDRIVAIDPETGVVKAELDMSGLLSPAEKATIDDKDDVLNGIAWNPETGRFYLTGKRWSKLFEVSIFPEKRGKDR